MLVDEMVLGNLFCGWRQRNIGKFNGVLKEIELEEVNEINGNTWSKRRIRDLSSAFVIRAEITGMGREFSGLAPAH